MSDDVTWNCRFHPTDGWHEIGCPHQFWTADELRSALITKKRFEQSGLKGQVLGQDTVSKLKNL